MNDRGRKVGVVSGKSVFATLLLPLLLLLIVPIVGFVTPSVAFAAPNIAATVTQDLIQLFDFPADTEVTVSVNGGGKGSGLFTTDGNGFCQINWWEKGNANRFLPGDTITAVYGLGPADQVEMIVQNLQATANTTTNSVAGTAMTPEGSPLAGSVAVSVSSSDWETQLKFSEATIDGGGGFVFNLNLSPPLDLVPGQNIQVMYWDGPNATGNRTMIQVYNGIPTLGANLRRIDVNGRGFPYSTNVTVSVKDKNNLAKGSAKTTTTDSAGNFWWTFDQDGNIFLPGDKVTAVIGAGPTTVQMTVQNLQGTADTEGNIVSGTARTAAGGALSNKRVEVGVNTSDWQTQLYWATATTDVNGNFSVNLDTLFDIKLGQRIWVALYDGPEGTGNWTSQTVYNGIPSLSAGLYRDQVSGQDFPFDTVVTVSVKDNNGAAKGTGSAVTTDAYGNFGWQLYGDNVRLLPGDTVTAVFEPGPTTVEMIVQNLQATVNTGTNIVSGTATTPAGGFLANKTVSVSVNTPYDQNLSWALTTTDVSGNFSIDFDLLSEPFDLEPGQRIWIMLWNAPDGSQSGNQTQLEVYNGIPTLGAQLYRNQVEGYDFPFDTVITVSVKDKNDVAKGTETTTTTGSYGDFWWQLDGDGNRLLPGDKITAVIGAGPDAREMTVPDLQATADPTANTVNGTATTYLGDPLSGNTVDVSVSSPDWQTNLAWTRSSTGNSGEFSVGNLDNGSPFDLVLGQRIWLTLYENSDGTGNRTMREVYNGIPNLGVMVDHRWIRGKEFPPDTDITVTINAGAKFSGIAKTDPWGNFFLGERDGVDPLAGIDLLSGDTVTAVGGGTTVTMVLQNVNAAVNLATNVVSGTALDGTSGVPLNGQKVSVNITPSVYSQEPHAWKEVAVGATGAFQFDFAGSWNIVRGDFIYLTQTSPQGHQTIRQVSIVGITGTVKGKLSGVGLPGVQVSVARELMENDEETWTDASGNYAFKNLGQGLYKVRFDAVGFNQQLSGNVKMEWWDNQPDFESAAWIWVSPKGAVLVLNAELEDTGGGIAGNVVDDGGLDMQDVIVCVQSAAWTASEPNCAYMSQTDVNGAYSLRGINPGQYKILFHPAYYNYYNPPANYALKWYGSTVTIVKGVMTEPINVQLEEGGTITGTVTGEGAVPPPALRDVKVEAYDANNKWLGDTSTNEDGTYALGALPPGTYRVVFRPDTTNEDNNKDYVYEWFQANKRDFASATDVVVAAGGTTSFIDAQLAIGGRITGQVTGTAGATLGAVQVAAYLSGSEDLAVAEGMTNLQGFYVIRGLTPADYKVFFDPSIHNEVVNHSYLPEWHNNQGSIGTATLVPVATDPDVVVNAALVSGLIAAPGSVSATDGTQVGKVVVSWLNVAGEIGYRIDRRGKGESSFTQIGETATNVLAFDHLLVCGTAIAEYRVTALYPAGAESAPSLVNTGFPKACLPAPALVNASDGTFTDKVNVTWGDVAGRAGFRVYRGDSLAGAFTQIGADIGPLVRTYDDLAAPPCGETRYYKVSAFDAGGESAWSAANPGATKICPPSAPASMTASDGTALDGSEKFKVEVAWDNVAGESGYFVYRALPGTSVFAKIATLASDITRYSDKRECGSAAYPYRVTAFKTAGAVTVESAPLGDTGKTATCGLTVDTPTDPWQQGSKHAVTWSGDVTTGMVKIDLYKGTIFKSMIVAATPASNNSYDWLLPAVLPTGADYRFKVSWTGNLAINAFSEMFEVESPLLTVTEVDPGGVVQGQSLVVGWDFSLVELKGNVSIALLKDGLVKATIAASTPNDGSFEWAVPALPPGGGYTLKVKWLSNQAVWDETIPFVVGSFDEFIVVSLYSEFGLKQGAQTDILWDAPLSGAVAITLEWWNGSGYVFKATIAASAPNVGRFAWTIPPALPSGDYSVKVKWLSKPSVWGAEGFLLDDFAGGLSVDTPVSPVEQGAQQEITWNGISGGDVSIALLQNGLPKLVIAAKTPNDKSFMWTVPATLAAGGNYSVKIVWLSKPGVSAGSGFFSVAPPPMTVEVPLETEIGKPQTITWEKGLGNGKVAILLLTSSNVVKATIAASALNNGEFIWTVPATLAATDPTTHAPVDYKVRVKWLPNPTVAFDDSDPFALQAPAPLTISQPSGAVQQGSLQTITWDFPSGIVPTMGTVSIQLLQNGLVKATIAASTPNDGSFDWTVPPALLVGGYTLRVKWLQQPAVFGDSDITAEMVAQEITAILPAGTTVERGSVQDITWDNIFDGGDVSITLVQTSMTDVVTKLVIAAKTPNDGSFSWTVPGTLALDKKSNILKIVWLTKPTVFGVSASSFTVTSPSLTDVEPSIPDVIWDQGTTQMVGWTPLDGNGDPQTPGNGNVRIELLKGGVVFKVLVASTPNDGSEAVAVPSVTVPASNYKVRVVWIPNPAVLGLSGAYFTIQ